MRVAGIVENSFVDGKGIRFAIFTQGCLHRCEGCHNPETHKLCGGQLVNVRDLANKYLENKEYLSGITLSGGDPFEQSDECIKLIDCIGESINGNIWCYTGYTFEQLLDNRDKQKRELLEKIDVLVDGKYEASRKSFESKFRGSSNQRLVNVKESIKANKVIEYAV